MAENTIKTRILQNIKTDSEWYAANPILKNKEFAYSSDKNYRFKVGDGSTNWRNLPYQSVIADQLQDGNSLFPTKAEYNNLKTQVDNIANKYLQAEDPNPNIDEIEIPTLEELNELKEALNIEKIKVITGQTSTATFTEAEQTKIQSAIGIYPWQEATF